jgi:hypothetical protein
MIPKYIARLGNNNANVIAACVENKCKLVYFDNTYAYPQDSAIQTKELRCPKVKGNRKKTSSRITTESDG